MSENLPSNEKVASTIARVRNPVKNFTRKHGLVLLAEIERLQHELNEFQPMTRDELVSHARAADEPSKPTKLHEVWCGWRQTSRCNCGAHPPVTAAPPSTTLVEAYELVSQAFDVMLSHAERHRRKADRENSDHWAASHRERADKSDKWIERAAVWLKDVETARTTSTKVAALGHVAPDKSNLTEAIVAINERAAGEKSGSAP